jgi:hypothetical protein
MMTFGLRSTSALGALVLAALLTLSPAPAAIGQSLRCFDDWSDAAPIVLRENLVPARDVQSWARKRLKVNVIRVTLCQDGDNRYIYRLLVREPKGRIRNRIIEARGPLEQGDPPKSPGKSSKKRQDTPAQR